MKPKKTIFACLKAFSCLAIICALMFLPPSATHAASGMHGDRNGASAHSGHAVAKHEHGAAPAKSIHGADKPAPNADLEEEASGQCCSGICVSVVLEEVSVAFVERPKRDKYLMGLAQPGSIESTGFLRPPLHLI